MRTFVRRKATLDAGDDAILLFDHAAQLEYYIPEQKDRDHIEQTKRAEAAGAVYYWDDVEGPMDQMIIGRLVCDWSITHDMIDQFIACLQSD